MRWLRQLFLVLLFHAAVAGSARADATGLHYRPRLPQTGVASWYGKKFQGKLTASGERYDMYALTAASRTLPLGSWAKVTNLRNRRSVYVRINDRGPWNKRIMDLSYGAARALGIDGIAKVMVEVPDGDGAGGGSRSEGLRPLQAARAQPLS